MPLAHSTTPETRNLQRRKEASFTQVPSVYLSVYLSICILIQEPEEGPGAIAMAFFITLSLCSVLVVGMGEGGTGSEEGVETECKPGLPPPCPSISPSAQPWTHPGQSELFADLSPEELTAVMSFLTQQLGPGLVDAAQARPSDNCVFSVELQLPPKAAALAHLDRGSPPPAREALAIVFFGGQPQPNVSELVVGPLPHPSYMRDVTVERHGGPLPYHRRPVLIQEYLDIDQMIFNRELPQAAGVLHHCCFYKHQGWNLVTMTTAPRGLQSGDRATWFGLYYNISGAGFYLHPVGLELLVDHKALDPAHWTIQKVFFQGRYYESLAQLEDKFEAGLVNVVVIPDNGTETVLVVRSVSTMLNYDYVWDMVFYPNGAIEVKFHATGYISSAFLFGAARRFGNQVREHTLGTVHTHSAHFKVDLDVGGLENWVWAEDMAFVPTAVPWSPEHQIQRMQVTRKLLETEEQAAFPLGGTHPRYLYLASNHSNKWGHPRGYRIQMLSFAGEPLPQNSSMERAFSWGRYQLAVTQRKEGEPSSTSIYNLNDPWTPTVDFTDFINNETVAGQDLVAWVTAGFLHIPHAEDIPNTVTVGNGVGFFLRPYNFFDQDPSFDSADSIYFHEDQNAGSCEVNPLACLSQIAACAPDLPAFSHGGFSHN
ncbi:PREDICTED: membrane primary amine oxidase isoform X2 [Ceratotherium simum simum]|uniref:Amine oxidase n=1 Tax=Ceratotherium simum simum TaxID=73337 RepID=A0ABM1D2U4_CERSS|nr:PREDICTED: membrane primary amine oxidase isoform X2 [Ceratotherium simum simum]